MTNENIIKNGVFQKEWIATLRSGVKQHCIEILYDGFYYHFVISNSMKALITSRELHWDVSDGILPDVSASEREIIINAKPYLLWQSSK